MSSGNVKTNILLSVVALLLLWVCVRSLTQTADFDARRAEREADVKQRLVAIRDAEIRFMRDHGRYCGSLDSLAAAGYMADSMAVIPHSGGKRFSLYAGEAAAPDGRRQPVVECSAAYGDFLGGLDPGAVDAFVSEAEAQRRYPGLKFGGRTAPATTAGSWE